jgi:sulfatase modifying factor 1
MGENLAAGSIEGDNVGKGRMSRRLLSLGLLVGAGLLVQGSKRIGDVSIAQPEGDHPAGFAMAEPGSSAAVRNAPPSEADRNEVRNGVRNSVTSTVLPRSLSDKAIADLPSGAKPLGVQGGCSEGMVKVDGQYCTEVKHDCIKWLDDEKLPYARCGEYAPEATCVGERVSMSFCIDQHEYTKPGDKLPMNHASFVTATNVCKDRGLRVCTESEWNFACEGEQMLPYPYGIKREAKCNQDRPAEDLYDPTNKKFQVLADRRMPNGGNPECVSPFGVYDMVGNLDEPVLREEARFAYPYRNGLKGGWWMPARNRCRPATTKHDDHYKDIQVGVRCCGDAPGNDSSAKG